MGRLGAGNQPVIDMMRRCLYLTTNALIAFAIGNAFADKQDVDIKGDVILINVSGTLEFARERQFPWTGAGICISPDTILTSYHLVLESTDWKRSSEDLILRKILISKLGSGKTNQEFAAVIASNRYTDLALLRTTNPTFCTPVSLASAKGLRDWDGSNPNFVVFSPRYDKNNDDCSIDACVTTKKPVGFAPKGVSKDEHFLRFIQTDRKVIEGDSGSPVVDEQGRVVAIVKKGPLAMSDVFYAVPIDLAADLLAFIRPLYGDVVAHYAINGADPGIPSNNDWGPLNGLQELRLKLRGTNQIIAHLSGAQTQAMPGVPCNLEYSITMQEEHDEPRKRSPQVLVSIPATGGFRHVNAVGAWTTSARDVALRVEVEKHGPEACHPCWDHGATNNYHKCVFTVEAINLGP